MKSNESLTILVVFSHLLSKMFRPYDDSHNDYYFYEILLFNNIFTFF